MHQHRRHVHALILLAACGGSPPPATPKQPPPAPQPEAWPVPQGWRTESFPFPLEFAPQLAHKGVEELRFAPGMFDAKTPGYWSYAFAWRLDDDANLTPAQISAELTAYFDGLLTAVDDKHRFASHDQVFVVAKPDGEHVTLAAHIYDAFGDGRQVDLVGRAVRTSCGHGSLWVFALAPATSGVTAELDTLVGAAHCDQQVVRVK